MSKWRITQTEFADEAYKTFTVKAKEHDKMKADKNDIVWTTTDKRIKTAKDCIRYLNDNIWNKVGDINTIKPSNMIKLKL